MSDCTQWREVISAWLDGQATRQEEREVQEHLQRCPACREWVTQVEADKQSFVHSLMGRQADISAGVMRSVSEMSVEPKAVAVAPARRPSFTLIELLVVIGIIAVMAAIMFPVFARAREKARQSSCMSNVRQIALAMLTYAQEHGSLLPSSATWTDSIQPFLKNRQLYICPTALEVKIGYAMVSRWSSVSIDSIQDPAHTIIIYEAVNGQPAYRHNDGMNVAYADGHVKWIRKLPADIAPVTAIDPAAPDSNYGLRRRLKLAYDASCEIWVKHIQEAVVAAEQVFYDRGGFVLNSTLSQGGVAAGQGPRPARTAHIEGRVPTAEVGATINALAALGYVAHRQIAGQDMTDHYVTTSRAVTQTGQQLAQVEAREAKAPAPGKPVLQERSRQVQQKLGQAQDALFGVEREAALATITATLIEKTPQASVSLGRIGRAWRSFVHTAGIVGTGLVWVLLYGLFLVPVIVGVWAYRRWKR